MGEPLELPFPLGGVSEAVRRGQQPEGTTSDALNVRAQAPDGRLMGAQRSGMSDLVDLGTGSPVQLLMDAPYQVDLIDYTQRTGALGTDSENSVLTKGGGTVAAVAVDSEHRIYALDVLGESVAVYSSELELQATIQLPLGNFDAAARSIAVDDELRVYVGAGNTSGPSFGAVWRYDKEESGRYSLGWFTEYGGDVIALRWRLGLLCVGLDVRDEEEPKSRVYLYSTTGGDPVEVWDRAMPYPVGDVDIDPDGNPLYTAPWFTGRRGLNEGFATREVDAAPHGILGDVDGTKNRLFFHVNADGLDGFASGDKVDNWPDYRFDLFWTTDTQTNYAEQVDDTDRYLQRKSGVGWQEAPEYSANAFGPLPGVRFDGVQMIRSRANTQAQNKTDNGEGEKFTKNRAIIPGVPGVNWATMCLLRMPESDESQIVFAGKGPLNIALAWNAKTDWDPDTFQADHKKGYLSLYNVTGGGDLTIATGAFEVAVSNDLDCALVTIIFNSSAGTGAWRVNGTEVGTFTFTESKMAFGNSSNATTVIGRTRVEGSGTAADPFGPDVNLKGFEGSIREWVTWLGGDGVPAAHGDAIPNGSVNDETEKMEGYMAWASGVGSILDAAHHYSTTITDGPPPGAFTNANSSPYTGGQAALIDDKAVVAKLTAGGGSVAWAYNEWVGAGLRVRAGKDDTVLTMGYRPEGFLPVVDRLTPLVRSVIDEGSGVELGTEAVGRVRFSGSTSATETVRIDGQDYTFEVAPSAQWDVATGTAEVSAKNLVAAINLRPETGSEYGALHVYPHWSVYATLVPEPVAVPTYYDVVLSSLVRGSYGNAIALSESGANIVIQTAMGSGDREAEGVWAYLTEAGGLWATYGQAYSWSDLNSLSSMEVDEAGDVYFSRPSSEGDGTGSGDYDDIDSPRGGVEKVAGFPVADDGTTTQTWYWFNGAYNDPTLINSKLPHNAVALAPRPDYGSADETITGPEFLYVGATGYKQEEAYGADYARENLVKLRTVSAARATVKSTRGHKRLAVSNGELFTWAPAALPSAVAGAALDGGARRVVGAHLYGRVYLSDGETPIRYDLRTGRATAWKAEKGTVPERLQLLAAWRGRMVGVSEKDPYNWHMARLGDPLDWDYKPNVTSAEQAIEGAGAKSLGRLAEPITAIIPESDEVLVFGCQNSIYVVRGDPMVVALGGYGHRVIGQLTNEHGVAPGAAWTKDPAGNLYVMGSKGALLRIARGGTSFDDLSKGRIRRRLEGIDWSQYYAELTWSFEDQGLHIVIIKYGGGGEQREHYFWEEITGAWGDGYFGSFWPDTYGVEPTATAQLDGDLPGERAVAFGGADGIVRVWNRAVVQDGLFDIHSRALIGPVSLGAADIDVGIRSLTTELGLDGGAADFNLYCSQSPVRPDYPVSEGTIKPGRNCTFLRGARGAYVWLEITNGSSTAGWSHERTVAEVHALGAARSW